MAYRDVTSMFVEMRQIYHDKRNRRSQRNGSSPKQYMSVLQETPECSEPLIKQVIPLLHDPSTQSRPQWISTVEAINKNIFHIKTKMEYLSKLHTRRLMVRFDDSEETEEHEIDCVTNDITQLLRNSEELLRKVCSVKETTTSYADRNIRRNIQTALATKLQDISSNYRYRQKQYFNRLKSQKGHARFDFLEDETNDLEYCGELFAIEDACNSMYEERDVEIQQIAKSIVDLSTIFKELSALVIDQGTVVDRIDYNMEQVTTSMKEAVKQLVVAERYQRSNRPFRCMAFLTLLIALCFLALLAKHA